MPADLHARALYRSPTFAITDYRCRAHSADRSGEEATRHDSIVFLRAGVFVKHVRGEAVVADTTRVLFFSRNEPYRVSHPVGCGDRCTSIVPSAQALTELLARHDPGALDGAGSFRATHGPADPWADARHRLLARALDRDAGIPGLAVDEAAAELVDRAVAAAHRPVSRRARAGTERAHRELAESARFVLASRRRERLTLDQVAAAVHSSPFHLARVFRRVTGMTMHRCLLRLRVREAMERLAGTRTIDLAALAAELGFYDQSHFSNAFRAEAGVTPDRWRRGSAPAG